ncbi:MAG: hypothetical protein F6K09_31670 [Merismopedia sp. SIO2A8]|nr:hypothetical protein [Merismopedia sp. SIO2A8]
MRLNLESPTPRLSLYVPRPTTEIPFLLDNSSRRVWSGQLPQTGYYEIVVMSDHPAFNRQAPEQPQSFRLTVAVDNVSKPTSGAIDHTDNPGEPIEDD